MATEIRQLAIDSIRIPEKYNDYFQECIRNAAQMGRTDITFYFSLFHKGWISRYSTLRIRDIYNTETFLGNRIHVRLQKADANMHQMLGFDIQSLQLFFKSQGFEATTWTRDCIWGARSYIINIRW